eukprot:scaffold67056_cov18-Tisochrysis_lutea.AAC.3
MQSECPLMAAGTEMHSTRTLSKPYSNAGLLHSCKEQHFQGKTPCTASVTPRTNHLQRVVGTSNAAARPARPAARCCCCHHPASTLATAAAACQIVSFPAAQQALVAAVAGEPAGE